MRPRSDWEELVRAKLAGLAIEPREKREVIEELTAHLEETYEALLREGVPDPEAFHHVVSLAGNWNDLQRKIYAARNGKDSMTNRVKQFWLPGFLTFLLSMGLLALTQIFGPREWTLMIPGQPPIVLFFIPWLFSLPLVGVVGAYLSYCAGGSRRAIFSSIVFPVLPFLASILVVLPVSLIFDHFIAHNIAPTALLMALLGWVLAPGVALLAGGLPIQFFLSRRLDSRRIVSN